MEHSNLGEDGDTQRRGEFYLKISIAFLILLGGNLALAWILQYYFRDSVISNISYIGNDASWIPKGTHFGAALGDHYFGDFEQYVGYAASRIPPYSSAIVYPAAYGPAAIIFVKLLYGIFGWPGAVLVFLPVTLFFFLWGISRLLGNLLSSRLLAILLLFSAGVIICLDRGNIQLLIEALSVWFCVGLLEDRPLLMIATLAFAMSIKLYVAVLLLILIRQKRWRDTGLILGTSAVLYLVGFAVVGGSYAQNIRNFVHTDFAFESKLVPGFMIGCVSATAAVYKILFLSWGLSHFLSFIQHSPSWYIQAPGLVVTAICLGVIWLARRPWELGLVAALAMAQLAPAATYPYVEMNMVIELVLILRILSALPESTPEGATTHAYGDPPISRRFLLVCVSLLLIGSAPWFGLLYGKAGSTTSLDELLSPVTSIGMIVVMLVGLLQGRWRLRRLHLGGQPVGDPPVAHPPQPDRVG